MKMSAGVTQVPGGPTNRGTSPAVRFPPRGFKQSELGLLPDEWNVVTIGDLHPGVTSGSRGWAKHYSDSGAPFLRIGNLSRDSIYLDLTELVHVQLPKDAPEAARTGIQCGDILISITADIGIVGWVSSEVPKPAYINQHVALIRLDKASASSRFIAYLLASERAQRGFIVSTDLGAKSGINRLRPVSSVHSFGFAGEAGGVRRLEASRVGCASGRWLAAAVWVGGS